MSQISDEETAGLELMPNSEHIRLNSGETWKRGREDFDYSPEVSLEGLSKFWTSISRVEIGPAHQVTAKDHQKWGKVLSPWAAWLDNTFRVTDRGSSFWIECIGKF
jgi:hypothetical protein